MLRSEDGTYALLQVYINGALMWSTPLPYPVDRGHLALNGTGKYKNLYVPGLNWPVSVHVWQYRRPALDEIRSLIEPFLWGLIEQSDGRILLAPLTYEGGHLGVITDTANAIVSYPDDVAWASVVRAVGAEVYGVYVDPRTITRGVRVVEVDSPYLWTEVECMQHAALYADLLYSNLSKAQVVAFLDPRIELLDRCTIDGVEYIVDGYTFEVSNPRNPSAIMSVKLRRVP